MKIKVALIVQGIISVVFGLGFLFMPVQMMQPYNPGQELTELFYFQNRAYGIAILSFAVLCWMGLKITDKYAKRVLAFTIATLALLSGIVFIYGSASGLLSTIGWSQVVVEFIMAGLAISSLFRAEP